MIFLHYTVLDQFHTQMDFTYAWLFSIDILRPSYYTYSPVRNSVTI